MTYTFEEIKDRFKECGVKIIGGSSEVKELTHILNPDEQINYATIAKLEKKNYLITNTDKRIIFIKSGLLKPTIFEIPISEISNPEVKKGIISSTISFVYQSKKIEINKVKYNSKRTKIHKH